MLLSIQHTLSHGISQAVIDIWKEKGIENLLPLQETALREYSFLRGENLIVFAPTSSGKTFIAEMAAIKNLESNKKVIYLVPTKALAEEKYRTFTNLYGKLGYKIVISTRERPESDSIVLDGSFDFLIAIYEKMKAYLVTKPEILSQVGLIIVDELQMMGEANRGDIIDMILTKIKYSPYKMQIIGLSAVLGDASHIANWLNCDLLVFNKRPVELREGIFNLSDNYFYYRQFNTGEMGKEKFDFYFDPSHSVKEDNFFREAVFSIARELVEVRNEQVIIFVPMRSITRSWAQMLAPELTISPAASVIKELGGFENTFSKELLINALSKGIAFHNADLSWDLRKLIEEYFNNGEVKILISTSTLGQGVNLTGRNAIIIHQMVSADEWTGNYTLVPLSRQRFRNQGGRIARFTKEMSFGRSILIARNKQEVDSLMKEYILSDFEPIALPLINKKLDVYILDLIASKIYNSKKEIEDFFLNTYSGTRQWNNKQENFNKLIDEGISSCLEKNMFSKDEEGTFYVSGIGKVAAINGIKPLTLLRFNQFLKMRSSDFINPLELLLAAAFTPDAYEFPIYLTYQERNVSSFIDEVKNIFARCNFVVSPYLRPFLEKESGYTDEDVAAIKKALLLNEWIGEKETREIEENFKLCSGTISNLAGHFSWLIQTMASLAAAMALPSRLEKAIAALAERLTYGVGEEGLALTKLHLPSLTRTYITALTRNNFNTIESLLGTNAEVLSKFLPMRIAEEIIAAATQFITPVDASPMGKDLCARLIEDAAEEKGGEEKADYAEESESHNEKLTKDDIIIEIDINSPQIVLLNKRKIRLTKLPYNLLLLLAKKVGKCVPYIEIDEVLWPDAKVEQQQIFAHKRAIITAFSKEIGRSLANEIILTLSGSGLMLALKPEQVRSER